MLMAGGSHHPTISALSSAGSTMAATAGGGAAEPASRAARAAMERSGPLRCPRCSSSNTKFCYYNNYSLCQPRHFCKACKRYWTRGGTLRNVPVGGGCRKNKRPKKPITSSSTATTSSAADPAAPKPPHSSRLLPTPIATAPSSASSSNLGPLFYGHASDARPIAFPHPCVSYNQQQSLGQLFPYDHQIIQQLPGCATPSLASLLHDYSLLGSNPTTSLHGSSLRQQQQQQRTTQNPNLSRYTTLLSPITSETSALPNDVVKMEADREWQTSGSTNQCGRFIWQVPSCESAVLETVAAESMSSFYWNAGAASAFGGGALQ